jgi:hypothetical protein
VVVAAANAVNAVVVEPLLQLGAKQSQDVRGQDVYLAVGFQAIAAILFHHPTEITHEWNPLIAAYFSCSGPMGPYAVLIIDIY